jgi:hypothetical protein
MEPAEDVAGGRNSMQYVGKLDYYKLSSLFGLLEWAPEVLQY